MKYGVFLNLIKSHSTMNGPQRTACLAKGCINEQSRGYTFLIMLLQARNLRTVGQMSIVVHGQKSNARPRMQQHRQQLVLQHQLPSIGTTLNFWTPPQISGGGAMKKNLGRGYYQRILLNHIQVDSSLPSILLA